MLVDRLWPRGISRKRAALDVWLAEREFGRRYRTELHDVLRRSSPARRSRARP